MLSHFFRTLQNFFYYHSIFALLAALAAFVAVWALIEYHLDRHELLYRLINGTILGITVLLIAWGTLIHRPSLTYTVSIIPLSLLFRPFGDSIIFMSMVLNIVLFIPLGMFGCCAFRVASKKAAVILIASGVAFSVLIEVLQYAMNLGNAEIDDVICNTLGLLAGCLIYDLYRRYILHRAKKKE